MTRPLPLRVRFEPRKRDGKWWVYDRAVASWPGRRPGVGVVAQAHDTETQAQAEADRLAAHYEGATR